MMHCRPVAVASESRVRADILPGLRLCSAACWRDGVPPSLVGKHHLVNRSDIYSHDGSISITSTSRIVVVGIGGATCSGKTTLAKHLLQILNPSQQNGNAGGIKDAFILHQDDFAPPEATLPVNEEFGVADWDHPPTAIDYKRMHRTIEHIKARGSFPPDFSSHDHLNSQPDCPISDDVASKWKDKFASLASSSSQTAEGVRVMLVDGFLLYYDPEVRSTMDVKMFLRTLRAVLKKRREERFGYATAEGTVWKDPEGYFDNIVWPAYELAHKNVFSNQDFEKGQPASPGTDGSSIAGGPVEGLKVLDAHTTQASSQPGSSGTKSAYSREMTELVDWTCAAIWEFLSQKL